MAQQKTPVKKAKKSAPKKAVAPAKKAHKTPEPKLRAKVKEAPAPKPPIKAKLSSLPSKDARRAAANLSKSDLTYFRNLLLGKRREILGDVGSMESEAFKSGSNLSNMPIHMADVGTDNFEQEFTLGLIESERQILREIQEALARIDEGTFGVCQGTGKPIPRVRLEAVPWAKYTIDYSRLLESGKVQQDNGSADDDEGTSGGGDDEED